MLIFERDIAMDIGTSTTLIYAQGKGVVLREPTVVAVDKHTGQLLKVGQDAQKMLGRTPANIVAIHPIQSGVISDYDMTVDEMVEEQMTAEPTVFTNGVFPASEENVEQYVNPENLVSGYEKYQFMDLSVSNNVDSATLDTYLKGKGVLDGHGSEFKKAADDNNVSEVYLVIHSCLETGNGSSDLANGVEYNGTTVYNLFGIGAVDESPIDAGAEYAYKQGWTSVEKAIEGGAKWISENYINNSKYGQNTLYKMRWNPEKPAEHQYATDIAWASKQAKSMSSMFEAFPTAKYKFEIPRYSGQEKLEVK